MRWRNKRLSIIDLIISRAEKLNWLFLYYCCCFFTRSVSFHNVMDAYLFSRFFYSSSSRYTFIHMAFWCWTLNNIRQYSIMDSGFKRLPLLLSSLYYNDFSCAFARHKHEQQKKGVKTTRNFLLDIKPYKKVFTSGRQIESIPSTLRAFRHLSSPKSIRLDEKKSVTLNSESRWFRSFVHNIPVQVWITSGLICNMDKPEDKDHLIKNTEPEGRS